MKILITGGCGFLGSNLALEALRRKADLYIYDNLSRFGSRDNLEWMQSKGKFDFFRKDIRDNVAVDKLIRNKRPDIIFHLAGQVAMTTSIASPRTDFEINVIGTLNVLESVRLHSPDSCVFYSSTNKVYGDLMQYTYNAGPTRYKCIEKPLGIDENVPLEFHSPYGCSKGAADQYMLDYARIFGLKTVVFRHSSMYGGRQFATYDQGWIGWFCQQGVEIKKGLNKEKLTISGNGKQVRDVLYADDMVALYFKALERIDRAKGQVFNVGGGIKNSLSLLELFAIIGEELGIKIKYSHLPARASDQKVFVADISKAGRVLGWSPKVDYRSGIRRMLAWLETLY